MKENHTKSQKYDDIISKTEQLPSLSGIVYEIISLINDPLVNLNKIEEAISKDPALAVQVLKIANSAFYGIPGGANSLSRAVTFLGLDRLYQIAITASVFENLEATDSDFFNVEAFWRHSFATAVASELLANKIKFNDPSLCFIVGLLHDIGKIIFLNYNEESWSQLCDYAHNNDLSIFDSENQLDALSHAECGYILAKKWHFPEEVQLAIRHHHDVNYKSLNDLDKNIVTLIDIVNISNNLIHSLGVGNSGYDKIPDLPVTCIKRLGLKKEKWQEYLKDLKLKLAGTDSIMSSLSGSD